VISAILPLGVASAHAFDDLEPAPLFAEEEAQLAGAKAKRRREYATVRRCARRALGELGVAPAALPRGEGGAPRWPDGVVGSMTHCAGYRAAAVAGAGQLAVLGIDAEPAAPLPAGVLGLVTSPAERERLAELAGAAPAIPWDRLLFCAKEAVYKAWFPVGRQWLGFRDATVRIEPDGTLAATVHPGGTRHDLGELTGRWLVRAGLVLATIVA
jgi:4'-phosphopantetheinyl transferase EntD